MNRKSFLTNVSAGLFSFGLPHENIFAQSEKHNTGVKITNVKPYIFSNALYVKIETDAGISGWGEGDHETTNIIGKFIDEVLKPVLIGQDPQQKSDWD